ncbi:cytochrome P450, partial [Nocardia concava]|uniref:cytochrome P450 n=1 Tax=Nocardia concava TaxID=257281 RepID=UPI0005953CF4
MTAAGPAGIQPPAELSRCRRADPHAFYAWLRDNAPVYCDRRPNGLNVWMITRYDDCRAALADDRLSKDIYRAREVLGDAGIPLYSESGGELGRHLVNCDPPEHSRLRSLVNHGFTSKQLSLLQPKIQQETHRLLDTIVGHGTVELLNEFAYPLTFAVICEVLEIPVDARQDFHRWTAAMFSPQGERRSMSPQQAASNACAFVASLLEPMLRERKCPAGNVAASPLRALIEAHEQGDHLSDAELNSTAVALVIAGYETSANMITNGVYSILRHPEQYARLLAEPELIDSGIDEFIRYESPVRKATTRIATVDIEIGGECIPRNSIVNVMIGSANRDSGRFPDAETLDVGRVDNPHLGFGHGRHYCVG